MIKAILAAKKRRFLSFWGDRRGNFAILTAVAAFPVMFTIGGVVDLNMYYTNRTKIQNATDAAALAAAKQYPFDPDETRLEAFAQDYFDANVGDLFRTGATLNYEGTEFNENNVRELTISVNFSYSPIFLPLMVGEFSGMDGQSRVESVIAIGNTTVEMAMVLDTSGSMDQVPGGGGAKKIVTLRSVASDAIDQLFEASEMAGVEDPVRISVVPFSGSVNLGVPLNTAWLDPKGLHPRHHDHLDWAKFNYTILPTSRDTTGPRVDFTEASAPFSSPAYAANQIAIRDPRSALPAAQRPWVRKDNNDVYLTRQYLLANMGNMSAPMLASVSAANNPCRPPRGSSFVDGILCSWSKDGNTWIFNTLGTPRCRSNTDPTCHPPYTLTRTSQYYTQSTVANPRVCAEVRSGEYSLTDETPNEARPASMFLPYFAPDEYDHGQSFGNNYLRDYQSGYWTHPLGSAHPLDGQPLRHSNNWVEIQKDVRKYLMIPNRGSWTSLGTNNARSPYYICESDPIVPLTNVSTTARTAVERLSASGATNVEEGVGWGWRTLTPNEPFTGGRAHGDENNYKALVVMTDGANTYYPNNTYNVTGYGAYGFAGDGRIFENTTFNPNSSSSYSSLNLTRAMDQRTARLCENAKNDGRVPVKTVRGDAVNDASGNGITRDGIIIYTIAFDIPAADKPRVDALLQGCASAHISDQRQGLATADSRKYFYSASSNAELEQAFQEIVASLSSLRIAR